MPGPYDDCVDVTDFCVVSETIYGYRPSLGATSFFIAIFAACMGIQTFQGIRWRNWFYTAAMTIGCLGEVVGKPVVWKYPRTCQAVLTSFRIRRKSPAE